MSIPYKMRPTGFDSWYVRLQRDLLQLLGSSEKFELAWIAPEKKLIIHTDRVDDAVLAQVAAIAAELVPSDIEVVQYNHHIEVSWRDINKYANCVTRDDVDAVNPNYLDDVTSDGWWVYPVPKLLQLGKTFAYGSGLTQAQRNKITHFVTGAPLAYNNYNNGGSEWPSYGALGFWSMEKLVEFRVTENRAERASAMFAGDKSLRIYRGALADCKDGEGIFDNCILDKDSVLHIAETLNDKRNYYKPKFCLGIHIDHQNDPEILAAIDTIAAKGWEVTVQWNPGGPTYTTPAT